ncbi:hypothetical protein J2S49_000947 [Arcanobacterium wilhelmae]|uniref:Uncharacterized protein n=1 Tax=Arcanobacterium wilhelmae TaxID=1803177 RepID=A0ABT9NCD7_9ACTO|nr:hypothetical protein [Arcanobacterium wilhelmae]
MAEIKGARGVGGVALPTSVGRVTSDAGGEGDVGRRWGG